MAGLGIDTIHELSTADLDQLAALNPQVTTVSRYGSSPGGIDKDIKQPEFTRIVNHPTVSLVCNWEDSGAEYEGGFAAGQRLGARARSFFRALGWPDERPIYFSSEGTATSPMTAAKAPLLYDYHRGINSVSPRGIEGMYGPGWAVAELLSRGLISHGWQWKDGSKATVAGAQVRQRYPTIPQLAYSHDTNDLLAVDHGQWNAASGQAEDTDLTPAQDKILTTILEKVLALPADVWAERVDASIDGWPLLEAGNAVGYSRYAVQELPDKLAELGTKLNGLTLDPPDAVALRAIVREEVAAALADLTLRSTPPS